MATTGCHNCFVLLNLWQEKKKIFSFTTSPSCLELATSLDRSCLRRTRQEVSIRWLVWRPRMESSAIRRQQMENCSRRDKAYRAFRVACVLDLNFVDLESTPEKISSNVTSTTPRDTKSISLKNFSSPLTHSLARSPFTSGPAAPRRSAARSRARSPFSIVSQNSEFTTTTNFISWEMIRLIYPSWGEKKRRDFIPCPSYASLPHLRRAGLRSDPSYTFFVVNSVLK